ncbi:MAG: transketolase [Bacteroidales bacterium]|jgi:transketolase|nr:transketolase [Bacteroidales bacterium]MDD2263453.1 transketolase [Bacteroidales bacterium]MDD2830757.1 transketolase [Bacteroidales bacterium]MDD3207956.1 transketolase [Bacteroidales bacterium]MDD3696537.1 transketolase [Bacteroidales bacterium]
MNQTIPYPVADITSQIRRDIIRMVTAAKSGHPGGSLSSTDFLTILFAEFLKQNPGQWKRDGRGMDMFFLSIGHISPLFYSLLARMGYFPVQELATFRKLGSRLQGHPSVEYELPGVHVASGSLGQGLSVACGAALSKRLLEDPHRVYVLLGDGESEEGQVWEAAMFAAHHRISNLTAITDWNGQQIDGPVNEIAGLGDLAAKWTAFGWRVLECDGHNHNAIRTAFSQSQVPGGKPVMILMHTHMGQGVDFMTGSHAWHGKAPSAEQEALALAQLPETLGDF